MITFLWTYLLSIILSWLVLKFAAKVMPGFVGLFFITMMFIPLINILGAFVLFIIICNEYFSNHKDTRDRIIKFFKLDK